MLIMDIVICFIVWWSSGESHRAGNTIALGIAIVGGIPIREVEFGKKIHGTIERERELGFLFRMSQSGTTSS